MKRLGLLVVVVLALGATLMWVSAPPISADSTSGAEIPSTAVPLNFPILRRAEAVANLYWASRDISVPPLAGIYELPNEPQFSEAGGYSELPGDRVWLASWVLEDLEDLSSLGVLSRVTLCYILIHERGHNAGLHHSDAAVFPIMGIPDEVGPGFWRKEVAPRCYVWAKHPFN